MRDRVGVAMMFGITVVGVAGAGAEEDARVAFLRDHAVAVRSIDVEDEDFSDLAPLVDLIGDATVVGLGEPTHGDGAHFLAKTRMIKFLHQVMGFDVLVWESGMTDCVVVNRRVRSGASIEDAYAKGVFSVWTASEQVQPLLEYVDESQETARPIEVAGMDCQLTGEGAADLFERLERIVDGLGESGAARIEALRRAEAQMKEDHRLEPSIFEEFDAACVWINERLRSEGARLNRRSPAADRSYLLRAVANFRAGITMLHWMTMPGTDAERRANLKRGSMQREPAMAETLVWLARERYPGRKLIVWAASSHLTYNSRRVETQDEAGAWSYDDDEWGPMGNHTREQLGDDFYVIDFIARGGTAGNPFGRSWPVADAAPDTIDGLCHATGHDALYVDLRSLAATKGGAWLSERTIARPRGYIPMRAVWPEICDAFFFVDEMTPSTAWTDR